MIDSDFITVALTCLKETIEFNVEDYYRAELVQLVVVISSKVNHKQNTVSVRMEKFFQNALTKTVILDAISELNLRDSRSFFDRRNYSNSN